MTDPIKPKGTTPAQVTPAATAEVVDGNATFPAEKHPEAADNYAPAPVPLVLFDLKRWEPKFWDSFKNKKPTNYPSETLLVVEALTMFGAGILTANFQSPIWWSIVSAVFLQAIPLIAMAALCIPNMMIPTTLFHHMDHMAIFKEEFSTKFAKLTGASAKEAKQVAGLYYRNRTKEGFEQLLAEVQKFLIRDTHLLHFLVPHDHLMDFLDLFDFLEHEAREQFKGRALPHYWLQKIFEIVDFEGQKIIVDYIGNHPFVYNRGEIFDTLINQTNDPQLIRSLNLGRMQALQYYLSNDEYAGFVLDALLVKSLRFVLKEPDSRELLSRLFDTTQINNAPHAGQHSDINTTWNIYKTRNSLENITNPQYALLILDVLKEKISEHDLNAKLFIYLCNQYEKAWQKAIEENERIAARTPEQWAMLRVIEMNSERAFSPPVDILEDTSKVSKEHLQQLDDLRLAVNQLLKKYKPSVQELEQAMAPYDVSHLPTTKAKLQKIWKFYLPPGTTQDLNTPYWLGMLDYQISQLQPTERTAFYDLFLNKLTPKVYRIDYLAQTRNTLPIALYLVDKKIQPDKDISLLLATIQAINSTCHSNDSIKVWEKILELWPHLPDWKKQKLLPDILDIMIDKIFSPQRYWPTIHFDFSPFETDMAQLSEKTAEKYLKKYNSVFYQLRKANFSDDLPEIAIQNFAANYVMLTRQLSRPKQLELFNQTLNAARKPTEAKILLPYLSVLGALALEVDLPKPQLKEWFSFLTQNIKHPSYLISQWTKNYLQENEDYFANHEDLAAIIQDLLGGLHVTLDPQVMQRTLAHVVEQVRYLQNDTGDEIVLGMGRALVRTGGDEALLPVLHTGMTKATNTGIRFMLDELRMAISLNNDSRLKQAYVQLLGEVTRYLEPEKHLEHLEEIIIHLISPLTKVRAKAASALQQALTFVSNLDLQFAKQMLIGHLEGNLWTAQLGSILGLEVVIKEHQTRNLDLAELAANLLGIYQKMTGPPKVKKALFQLFVNVAPAQTTDSKPLELSAGEILLATEGEDILPAQDEITAVDLTDAAAIPTNDDAEPGANMGPNIALAGVPSLPVTESLPGMNGLLKR